MTDSGTDVPVVGGDIGDSGVAGTTIRRLVWVAPVAVLAVIAVPGWASFSYRSAVHDLHRELAATEIDSVDVVDVRIERCWNGLAPASVRVLVPTGDQTLTAVITEYVAALEPLGFVALGGVTGTVASRPRTDALDDDLITVTIDVAAGRAVVAADPFDADMVSCLPFQQFLEF